MMLLYQNYSKSLRNIDQVHLELSGLDLSAIKFKDMEKGIKTRRRREFWESDAIPCRAVKKDLKFHNQPRSSRFLIRNSNKKCVSGTGKVQIFRKNTGRFFLGKTL